MGTWYAKNLYNFGICVDNQAPLLFEKSIFFLSLAQKYRNFLSFNTMSTENKKPNRSLNPMDFTFNDVEQLSRFVTETGKILPRKITGLSAKHQRRITNTIKRARNMITMK